MSRLLGAAPATSAPAPVSCVPKEGASRTLVEVAAVAPEEYRRIPKPQDRGWVPFRLADLAVLPGGIAVLDAGAPEVALFTPDFRQRREWGRKGRGPGEFIAPVAIAASADSTTLWVLDNSPPRLIAFDTAGHFIRQVSIDNGGQDLAIGPAGEFYVVAGVVFPELARSDPERYGAVVTIYTREGGHGKPFVEAAGLTAPEERLLLPGSNSVRVKTFGRDVVVFYPVAAIADVYQGGRYSRSVRGCLPEALRSDYAAQRREAKRGRHTQTWVPLVTDVLEEDGRLSLVGPLPDEGGRYHVDHFDTEGEPLPSTMAPAGPIHLPGDVRFAGNPRRLVAFNESSGIVVLFDLRD